MIIRLTADRCSAVEEEEVAPAHLEDIKRSLVERPEDGHGRWTRRAGDGDGVELPSGPLLTMQQLLAKGGCAPSPSPPPSSPPHLQGPQARLHQVRARRIPHGAPMAHQRKPAAGSAPTRAGSRVCSAERASVQRGRLGGVLCRQSPGGRILPAAAGTLADRQHQDPAGRRHLRAGPARPAG